MVQKGIYEHYKGKRYEVVGIAKHSETLEDLVVYRPLYETEVSVDFWVRPLAMFTEVIVIDGRKIPRFSFVKNKE